jgi:hypothetical protein
MASTVTHWIASWQHGMIPRSMAFPLLRGMNDVDKQIEIARLNKVAQK